MINSIPVPLRNSKYKTVMMEAPATVHEFRIRDYGGIPVYLKISGEYACDRDFTPDRLYGTIREVCLKGDLVTVYLLEPNPYYIKGNIQYI